MQKPVGVPPRLLFVAPKTDSGSEHQPHRVVEYELETKKGETPNQSW